MNTRCRIYLVQEVKVRSSSTVDIMDLDIDAYRMWIEYQFTSAKNWSIYEIDHVRPLHSFDVSNNKKLEEASAWKLINHFQNKIISKNRNQYSFVDYQFQFIKAYQFLTLNEDGLNRNFTDEINSIPPKKNYPTNKTLLNYVGDTWRMDTLDPNGYGPEKKWAHRFI